jgi:hypothetical protein
VFAQHDETSNDADRWPTVHSVVTLALTFLCTAKNSGGYLSEIMAAHLKKCRKYGSDLPWGVSRQPPAQVLLQNGVERATEVDTRAWMYFIRLSGGPMECCAANLKSRAGTGATLVGLAASPARTLLCQRGI